MSSFDPDAQGEDEVPPRDIGSEEQPDDDGYEAALRAADAAFFRPPVTAPIPIVAEPQSAAIANAESFFRKLDEAPSTQPASSDLAPAEPARRIHADLSERDELAERLANIPRRGRKPGSKNAPKILATDDFTPKKRGRQRSQPVVGEVRTLSSEQMSLSPEALAMLEKKPLVAQVSTAAIASPAASGELSFMQPSGSVPVRPRRAAQKKRAKSSKPIEPSLFQAPAVMATQQAVAFTAAPRSSERADFKPGERWKHRLRFNGKR